MAKLREKRGSQHFCVLISFFNMLKNVILFTYHYSPPCHHRAVSCFYHAAMRGIRPAARRSMSESSLLCRFQIDCPLFLLHSSVTALFSVHLFLSPFCSIELETLDMVSPGGKATIP